MQNDRAWTYILANQRDGILFAGATPDLMRRVAMHRQGVASHFTRRHKVTRLVWYEPQASLTQASLRRDIIRHCRRRWKLNLIDASNPEWLDLFEIIMQLPFIPLLPQCKEGSTRIRVLADGSRQSSAMIPHRLLSTVRVERESLAHVNGRLFDAPSGQNGRECHGTRCNHQGIDGPDGCQSNAEAVGGARSSGA